MLELLSPAGSPEAVTAAVQNGADAIYLGFDSLNARRGAKNFTEDEFRQAAAYCRVRGAKVYAAINTLIGDSELGEALRLAKLAWDAGADAVIVQDLGFARCLREMLPDLRLHADAKMGCHNLAGVQALAEMGFSRAVLSRRLGLEQVRAIAAKSPIELEIFVHGAQCVSHVGQCYFSSMMGLGCDNRGLCDSPCHNRFSLGGRMDDYPLSMKDLCLIDHIGEIKAAGISAVKIEGRPRRPEYTAIVTGIYSRAIKHGKQPSESEMEQLVDISLSGGFTSGYYGGDSDENMFGKVTIGRPRDPDCFAPARRAYIGSEARRVPVTFYAVVKKGESFKLAVEDRDGHLETVEGDVPMIATSNEISKARLEELLYKTGGTPYSCDAVKAYVEPGLHIDGGIIDNLRHILLDRLSDERAKAPERAPASLPTRPKSTAKHDKPCLTIQVCSADQLTPQLAEAEPELLYIPLTELAEHFGELNPFLDRGCRIAAVLPRIIAPGEESEIVELLTRVRTLGVGDVLIGNLGHVRLARRLGFATRADATMNAFNSFALKTLDDAGFVSATVPFELNLKQIQALVKPLDTEMIVYGRVPVMLTESCLIKLSSGRCSCKQPVNLSDGHGLSFPVMKDYGCRNTVLSSHKIYMADKREEYENAGLWGVRLLFTTESGRECASVASAYLDKSYYRPNGLTRGLYMKGAL